VARTSSYFRRVFVADDSYWITSIRIICFLQKAKLACYVTNNKLRMLGSKEEILSPEISSCKALGSTPRIVVRIACCQS
jgi:hypothetical protein